MFRYGWKAKVQNILYFDTEGVEGPLTPPRLHRAWPGYGSEFSGGLFRSKLIVVDTSASCSDDGDVLNMLREQTVASTSIWRADPRVLSSSVTFIEIGRAHV